MLQIVGSCQRRLFGLDPAERLARQYSDGSLVLVADHSAVLSEAALHWLLENPGVILTSPSGRRLAVAVVADSVNEARFAIETCTAAYPTMNPADLPDIFVRKLRRRAQLFARSVEEGSVVHLERELFDSVYKGVTDLVTKYAWPVPAFWLTRHCAHLGIRPNTVTVLGISLTFAAAFLWFRGELVAGMACAWAMTFLDTVDGKLARVTVTSSRLGNKLDHLTDIIHPPIWWLALTAGIIRSEPEVALTNVQLACAVILITYILGRFVETAFKRRIGYNCYLWQPFDSQFRLVVSRRNVILLIMTAGLLLSAAAQAFYICAFWSLASSIIQVVRYAQAVRSARNGSLASWLM